MQQRETRRVALVGAGFIAEFHALALRRVAGVDLVAVCDLRRSKAEQFAAAWGIEAAFSSLDELLDGERPDAIHVLLPPAAHFAVAERALSRGVDVLLEKPMCTNLADCEALRSAAEKAGRRLGVSHNFLFAREYTALRADVVSGRLGQLDRVEVNWGKFFGPAKYGPFSLEALASPTGILFEVMPHSLAHALDLVGDLQDLEVRVEDRVLLPTGIPFYRRWVVSGQAGRTRVVLNYSFIEGYTEHRILVRGTHGSATVDLERAVYQLHRHRPQGVDLDRWSGLFAEALASMGQATRTYADYALSKAGLADGAPFQASIVRAVRAFYNGGPGVPRGLDAELGTRVVALAERIADAVPRESRPADAPVVAAPCPPAEVLVTGGTGFIGREVVRQIRESGRGVRIVSRGSAVSGDLKALGVELVQGSLKDPEFAKAALSGIQHVVHLARSQGNTWAEYLEDDVKVTEQLARMAAAAGVRTFVYASSIAIYYAGQRAGRITEATPPGRQVVDTEPYARSKVETERMLLEMHRSQSLPVVIVRPGIVVGKGGNPCHWGVGMWPDPSVCQTWGSGDTPLPFVLVTDVANAIVRCLDRPAAVGESFNLVGGPPLTAKEYLDAFEQAAGIKLQRTPTPIWQYYVGDLVKYVVKVLVKHPNRTLPRYRAWESRSASAPYDYSKAERLLGWTPVTDRERFLELGIREPAREYIA